MGAILSKLLGSKVTLRERLEKVDKELRNIQRFQFDTEISQKRWIGRLIVISSVLYLTAAAAFYFFGPTGPTWKTTILYLLPFLVFPFLIWGLKRLMAWYYKRKIGNNVDTYKELKVERQRLLEDVMEFETFNNAKEILEKYDPNRLLPKYLAEQRLNSPSTSPTSTPITSRFGADFQDTIRRRNLTFNNQPPPRPAIPNTPFMRPIPGGPQGQFLRQTMNMPLSRPAIMPSPTTSRTAQGPGLPPPPPPPQFMPRPPPPTYMMPQPPGNPTLHNRRTGWLDKLVDYWVGDGPANRYALICRYCATHNGLAIPEDFPYIGYRCVFCRQYNPPRQVRPAAEKLPVNTVVIEELSDGGGIVTSPAASQVSSSSPRKEADEPWEEGSGHEDSRISHDGDDINPDQAENTCDLTEKKEELEDAKEKVQVKEGQGDTAESSGGDRDKLVEESPQLQAEAALEGAGSAESLSSENEPFEFLDSEVSPEGKGQDPPVIKFLSEAANDLESTQPKAETAS